MNAWNYTLGPDPITGLAHLTIYPPPAAVDKMRARVVAQMRQTREQLRLEYNDILQASDLYEAHAQRLFTEAERLCGLANNGRQQAANLKRMANL